MILDALENAGTYYGLHRDFAKAFAFLQQDNLADVEDGRYEIDGDRVFAMVSQGDGVGQDSARLECHRRYIDIQYCVTRSDLMGWAPLEDCRRPEAEFDDSRDIQFFVDPPETWVEVLPGRFVIFFPEDAHAPVATDGQYHKVVLKIACTD
jgi:YhcH/YjgK/YiaL family protein